MAREFSGANQYLIHTSAVIASVPVTLACWFRSHDVTIEGGLIAVGKAAAGFENFRISANGIVAGDPVQYHLNGVGDPDMTVNTTTGFSANTWHHACCRSSAIDNHAVYIDGGSKGTSVVSVTPDAGANRTSIGCIYTNSSVFNPLDGEIAEAAIWNAALTDEEVAVLATGIRPIMVRPQNIVAYWPLVRDQDYDLVGGYDMTPVNGPTVSAHVPIIYGAIFPNAALAAGPSPSISPSASVSPSASESPSESPSLSPSASISPSASESPSVSPSASISPSASESPSSSESPSPSPSPAEMEVVWGHDTGVLESNVRDFQFNWTGTGTIENPGVADIERLALESTENMVSEVVNTGNVAVEVLYNVYVAGDNINLDYRHGATVAACEGAGWNDYVGPFVSLGFIQVRTTSTL